MQEFVSRTLVCQRCGTEFPFAPGEQAFYSSRGIKGEPKLCPECRTLRRQSQDEGRETGRPVNSKTIKEKFPAICASCGSKTEVPFKPKHDRPVYCKECYESRRHLK